MRKHRWSAAHTVISYKVKYVKYGLWEAENGISLGILGVDTE